MQVGITGKTALSLETLQNPPKIKNYNEVMGQKIVVALIQQGAVEIQPSSNVAPQKDIKKR